MEYNEKQVQIMETAEILFAEKGFNGTSVRDIAEKANVNLAMISYYFGSKDKLLEALFGYRGEYFKLKLETMIDDKELSSLEKMNTLIDHYIEKIMQQQCFSRIRHYSRTYFPDEEKKSGADLKADTPGAKKGRV